MFAFILLSCSNIHLRKKKINFCPHSLNYYSTANLHDKTEYVIHIRNLKQALNHGLVLKNVHRVIKFSQNALLKPYIDMNADLKQKQKNDFEKDFEVDK